MNIERLRQLCNLIIQVPSDMFDMSYFRKEWDLSRLHECKTVGCLLGHATILDSPENVDKFRNENGFIDFKKWGEKFFEINQESPFFDYLFSGNWSWSAQTKTKFHAIYRVGKIISGYKPNKINVEYLIEKQKLS